MKNNGILRRLFLVTICIAAGLLFIQSSVAGLGSRINSQESIVPNVILLISALVSIGTGIGLFRKMFATHNQAVRRFIAANKTDGLEQKVKLFLEETEEFSNIKINDEFIYFYIDGLNYYLDYTSNVVWSYAKYTSYQLHGYEAASGHDIVIRFFNGKGYLLTLRNQMEGDQFLQKIARYCPRAVVGYADDLNRKYRRNRSEFLKLKFYS